MKKLVVFLLFILISMTLVPVTWAQGNPLNMIRDLQNQINNLQTKVDAIPQPINIKGCWTGEFVTAQSGGGTSGVSPIDQPFYATPGAKRIGQYYLRVDSQWGMKFTGVLLSYSGYPPSGQFYSYPVEGYINGNLISYYSFVTPGQSPTGTEEQRFFNGLITADRTIYGSGTVAKNLNPNAYPECTNPAVCGYKWALNVLTVKYSSFSDSCNLLDLPDPVATDVLSGPKACLSTICPPTF